MHANRWLWVLALVVMAFALASCGQQATSTGVEPPAVLEELGDDELVRIRLTQRASERLGLETAPVASAGGGRTGRAAAQHEQQGDRAGSEQGEAGALAAASLVVEVDPAHRCLLSRRRRWMPRRAKRTPSRSMYPSSSGCRAGLPSFGRCPRTAVSTVTSFSSPRGTGSTPRSNRASLRAPHLCLRAARAAHVGPQS